MEWLGDVINEWNGIAIASRLSGQVNQGGSPGVTVAVERPLWSTHYKHTSPKCFIDST